jgi:predicted HTH domain antitoxin
MNGNSKFLAMWDCNGLECLFDITDIEGDAMIAGLKNEKFKTPFNISMMMMRARLNSQRSYEIYTFEVQGEISKDEMIELFEDSPQYFAELIREKGNKLYSDYSGKQKVIS